jgi:hypothetical protein
MYSSWSGKNSLPFDPLTCSWSDVLEQLRKACEATAKADAADAKFRRRSQRTFSNASKYLGPGLDAIPDFLGPLRGGLGMIFHVLLVPRRTFAHTLLT